MEKSVSDDKLTIETPEQIPLEFPLAGIGSRFLALALDSLIQFVITLAVGVVAMVAFFGAFARFSSSSLWILAILVLLVFVIQFGYFAFFEAMWGGQTPGKRSQRLRVIKDSGQPITTYDAIGRNLLRTVDSLPGFYGIGIISVMLSSKHQRLGDYVAGTVVVHEKPLAETGQVGIGLKLAEAGPGSGYQSSRLSTEEFQLIEAYLLRRSQLAYDVRSQLMRQIVQRIAAKLELSAEDQQQPEPVLEKLVTEYRNQPRFK